VSSERSEELCITIVRRPDPRSAAGVRGEAEPHSKLQSWAGKPPQRRRVTGGVFAGGGRRSP